MATAISRKSPRRRSNWPTSSNRVCAARAAASFVLIAETPRPTVAQLLQMPPSMEPVADSPEVQYHLPLSAGL